MWCAVGPREGFNNFSPGVIPIYLPPCARDTAPSRFALLLFEMLVLLHAASQGLLLAPTAPRCRPLRMAEMMAPADTSLIQIEADADAVGKAVLAKVDLAAAKAIGERGHFALAIPGGSVLKMLQDSKPAWADK